MPVKVWVIQHTPPENLGIIAPALDRAGFIPYYVNPYLGEMVPQSMDDAAGLIVMGGPMGVYEHGMYQHLRDEIYLIKTALSADKPVLGVCLGSQLLASALGAPVTKSGYKEIGWFPVTLSDAAKRDPLLAGVESPFTALHWHGDVFDLPGGAEALASSELTPNQAFRYGKAYGFLFHMEVTHEIVRGMVDAFPVELSSAQVDGAKLIAQAGEHLTSLQKTGASVFSRWVDLLKK